MLNTLPRSPIFLFCFFSRSSCFSFTAWGLQACAVHLVGVIPLEQSNLLWLMQWWYNLCSKRPQNWSEVSSEVTKCHRLGTLPHSRFANGRPWGTEWDLQKWLSQKGEAPALTGRATSSIFKVFTKCEFCFVLSSVLFFLSSLFKEITPSWL